MGACCQCIAVAKACLLFVRGIGTKFEYANVRDACVLYEIETIGIFERFDVGPREGQRFGL